MTRITILVLSIILAQVARADAAWPLIKSASKSVSVMDADNPAQAGVEMNIYGRDSTLLYNLMCHSGDYDSNDPNYSGLIQCYLFSRYSTDRVMNLLNESYDLQRDWQNRGRFLSIHLVPRCSSYPEWGSTRHFKLRGLELTLSISDVVFVRNPSDSHAPLVKSYRFRVTAKPSPGSTSDIAERVHSPQPPWFYSNECKPI